ncbi:hypothetical protein GCM10022282_01980 [Agromyces indicus]
MTGSAFSDLGLTAKTAGCACCSPIQQTETGGTRHREADAIAGTASAEYSVDGMTCSHCVSSVTEELTAIPGVLDVSVELNRGVASQVRIISRRPVEARLVQEAVEEAGYRLASP